MEAQIIVSLIVVPPTGEHGPYYWTHETKLLLLNTQQRQIFDTSNVHNIHRRNTFIVYCIKKRIAYFR